MDTAGKALASVRREVLAVLNELTGSFGIAVMGLKSNATFLHNEHLVAPAASTIKIHILLELFNQLKAGKHSLDEFIEIPTNRDNSEWHRTSSGILKDLTSIRRLSWKDAGNTDDGG